ncbi:GntR family transcriptional regulator [Ammoniphilus sp. 3BR4]|uniref:GntR family transcriptional regulator n=1 Tax=Ammoniphilus sp. 3BR4 TaxID=3158265 RepID=UPI0034679051
MTSSDTQLYTEKLSDQVYVIIRDRIINNLLKPGTRLNFIELQEELKISKTPLREALNRLNMEGLVDVKPRSGSYITVPTKQDIIEIYDLRQAIEMKAVQLAIEHLPESALFDLQKEILHAEDMIKQGEYEYFMKSDTNFHGTILKYCGNVRIQNVMSTIESHIRWFGVITATTEERMYHSSRRHKQILEALFDKNGKLARDLLEIHIEEVKLDMLDDYSKTDYFNMS